MKKVLSALLILCIAIPMFTFASNAVDPVASVGANQYQTLDDAVNAVNSDSGITPLTLTLLQDVTATTLNLKITRDNVTVDGGDKKLTVTANTKGTNVLEMAGKNAKVQNLQITANYGGIIITGSGDTEIKDSVVNLDKASSRAASPFTAEGNESAALNLKISGCKTNCGKSRPLGTTKEENVVNITLENNEFIQPKTDAYGGCIDIYSSNTTITVISGYYEIFSTAVFRLTAGKLIIKNGTFFVNGNGDVILTAGSYTATTGGTVVIDNGLFISKNAQNNKKGCVYSPAGIIEVNGGTFINAGTYDKFEAVVKKVNDTDSVILGFPTGSKIITKGVDTNPSMETGASARLVEGKNGICFTSTIKVEALNAAKMICEGLKYFATEENPAEVVYGTLICPEETLKGPGGNIPFTHMELSKALEAVYYDVPATQKGTTVGVDGTTTIRASVSNIGVENKDTVFCAVSYIMITAGSYEFYFYSNYNEQDNSRSLTAVVNAAIADADNGCTDAQKTILNTIAAGN